MKLSVNMDTSGLEKTLRDWELRQLPFATASALTATAKRVQVATVAEMRKVFDRPTPFTLNSTVVRPATKSKMFAELILKNANQKGAPPSVWLEPNIEGGVRQAKRTETMLRSKGFLPSGMFYVPGLGADLNRYGNISAGQLIKVMSALQAMPEQGYLANKSERLSARVNANAGTYFVGKPAGGYLPLGVYQRMPDGKLKSILVFVKTPHYHKILPFYELAREVFGSNFQAEFNKALRNALILSPILGRAA
jgi:hypothetical protein